MHFIQYTFLFIFVSLPFLQYSNDTTNVFVTETWAGKFESTSMIDSIERLNKWLFDWLETKNFHDEKIVIRKNGGRRIDNDINVKFSLIELNFMVTRSHVPYIYLYKIKTFNITFVKYNQTLDLGHFNDFSTRIFIVALLCWFLLYFLFFSVFFVFPSVNSSQCWTSSFNQRLDYIPFHSAFILITISSCEHDFLFIFFSLLFLFFFFVHYFVVRTFIVWDVFTFAIVVD